MPERAWSGQFEAGLDRELEGAVDVRAEESDEGIVQGGGHPREVAWAGWVNQ
jgi:hypothetical protein